MKLWASYFNKTIRADYQASVKTFNLRGALIEAIVLGIRGAAVKALDIEMYRGNDFCNMFIK